MKTQERFERLLAAWKKADIKRCVFRRMLEEQYGKEINAPYGKAQRMRYLDTAETNASEAFFLFLDTLSPRNWRATIPYVWIRENITYELATITDALPIIPPFAWGYTASDAKRFAAAIPERKASL